MRVLIICTTILAYANAAPSHLVPLSPLAVRTIAYPAAISTVSSGDIQAAAIDAHVKYADLAQAAVDKARQISEQTVEDLNVNAYSSVAVDQTKLTDVFWANEDKKWQNLDIIKTAEAQLDGAIASNAPALAKGAIVGSFVAAVAPYSALPTISPGDIQAAAIDAHVKYTDLAQEAVDKAKQISETAQAHLDDVFTSNIQGLPSGAFVSPYVYAVAPINSVVYSGYVAPATKSISNQFLLQTHPATSKAEASDNTAENSVKANEAITKTDGFIMKPDDASMISAESDKSDNEKSMKTAETSINSAESEKSEVDKTMKMAEASINYSKSEKSDIENSMKTGEDIMNSPESEKSEIDKSLKMVEGSIDLAGSQKSEIEKSMKMAEGSINLAESEIDRSMKTAEGSVNSVDFKKSEIEKSVKAAEAALEAAKSKADKAFAALQSPFVSQTVGLTNAYLIPRLYASLGLGQPILDPLQPIAPIVDQTYLKTLC